MTRETTPGRSAEAGPLAPPAGPVAGSVGLRRLLRSQPAAWVVLGLSLAATLVGWFNARDQAALTARQSFDAETGRVAALLGERLLVYQDVLHGAAGLYAASVSVERGEFRTYFESLSIEKRLPGIDGLGFIAAVPREGLEQFLKATRADHTPEFAVRNAGDGPDVFIVKYLEPEARHQGKIGQDVGSDPEWRALAEAARDRWEPVVSGNLTLAAPGGGTQPGFLMMLPVARNRHPHGTLAERRANIDGWIHARFVTAQLITAVMGDKAATLALRILDDTPGAGDRALFESDARPVGPAAGFSGEVMLTPGGRQWRLQFFTKPGTAVAVARGGPALVAGGGTLLSLLLFGIVLSLSTTRERAVAMASDMMAALRSANERLEHERYLLQTLLDNLPDHIYFKDRQSRFLRNSRAHLQVFGLSDPAQAAGKTDFDFFTEEHARQAYDDEQEILRTGQPLTKEEKETWPDGSLTWVLTTKMPLRDASGQIVGTFGSSRDITDRKRAEEAMRLGKEAAEEANRAKSHFLASMSHELRTPLNSIIGFANILIKNKAGALGPADVNFLDRIQANGKHLLALINEILDLSKIEAQKVELRAAPVALDELVRDTVAQAEGLVRDKPVELRSDLPARIGPIVADDEKLRQVLINLIGNALKFTEQGSVTVRVVTDPADDRPLRLEVCDTGIGIPPEKLGVIFEAFQQAEAGTARKYGGTGLGLTISQALCRLMGFEITVASEVGHGSTFSILLHPGAAAAPRPAPPAPAAQRVAPGDPVSLAGKLVLVIDDQADSRTLLTHLIEETGCDVVSAASAELGLGMARKLRPELILTDLLMPGTDGWQVVQAVRADPVLRAIPVVAVTVKELSPEEVELSRRENIEVLKKAVAFGGDLRRLLFERLAGKKTEH